MCVVDVCKRADAVTAAAVVTATADDVAASL